MKKRRNEAPLSWLILFWLVVVVARVGILYWGFLEIEDEGIDGALATAVGDIIDAVVIFILVVFI